MTNEDRQDRKIEQLYDWMAEVRVSVAIIRAQQEEVIKRPTAGVPVWAVLVFAVPQTLIAICLLAIALAAWVDGRL